jgi:two-component sensor histidine kinase
MMINELNHRVKNTLATVQSIVWQALRRDSDPKAIRESIESRLFALSRSHDLLTREYWEGAGLLDLVKAAMEPFGAANGGNERLVILLNAACPTSCKARQISTTTWTAWSARSTFLHRGDRE